MLQRSKQYLKAKTQWPSCKPLIQVQRTRRRGDSRDIPALTSDQAPGFPIVVGSSPRGPHSYWSVPEVQRCEGSGAPAAPPV